MITKAFNVEGMSCGHCKAAVEKTLRDLGVKGVEVDLAAKKVTVTYDDTLLSPEKIASAIEEAGYDVV